MSYVFVLIQGEYDSRTIIGAYSSLDAAVVASGSPSPFERMSDEVRWVNDGEHRENFSVELVPLDGQPLSYGWDYGEPAQVAEDALMVAWFMEVKK